MPAGPGRGGGGRWWWLLAAAPISLLGLIVLVVLLAAGGAQQQCGASAQVPGDFTGPGSLGHVAGTGLTAGQVQAVRDGSPYAGTRITPGRYLSTAYGPPWGGIQGAGRATSGGLVIGGGAPRWYVVAVDPLQVAHGTLVYLWPNPFGWPGPFLAADTGGAIRARRIDFYDWRGRAAQYRWGHRQTQVSAIPIVAGGPPAADQLAADSTVACSTRTDAAALALPGWRGRVTAAALANAPGQPVRPQLIAFLGSVAGIAGRELILTTGTRHTLRTVSGHISDHILGLAGDFGSAANHFPNGAGFGTTLAASALRAAGVSAPQALALAAAGGGHNVCHHGWRVQVIWRTGGHYDHVHIGLRHGCTFPGVQTFQL